jgi:hypothetical protein
VSENNEKMKCDFRLGKPVMFAITIHNRHTTLANDMKPKKMKKLREYM